MVTEEEEEAVEEAAEAEEVEEAVPEDHQDNESEKFHSSIPLNFKFRYLTQRGM